MAAFPLALNSLTVTGSVRALCQEITPAADLGRIWTDSIGWTSVAETPIFNDYTFPVVAQNPGETYIGYHGKVLFDNDFTGDLGIGYKDTGDSNANVFSEIHHFRNGQKVSFVIADQYTDIGVAEPFIFKMGRRADGVIVANNDIHISDVAVVPFGFDVTNLVTIGETVALISNVVVAPTGSLTVTKVGKRDQLAILITSGSQVAGTDYSITCDVLTSKETTLQLNGTIKCVATP